jgi:hypothetical protein
MNATRRSIHRVTLVALLQASLSLCAGCRSADSRAPQRYEFLFRVSSDPGHPLQDVGLLVGGKKLATTGQDGAGRLVVPGVDGETVDAFVSCPEGFRSPKKPVPLRLARIADPAKTPEFSVACPPSQRTIVVAVRADGGPDLPIMHLGREIARTDASGAAHVLLKAKPDDTFSLTLDTSGKGREQLKPKSPGENFVVKDQDDVFTFTQTFTMDRPPPVRGPGKPVNLTPRRR